MFRSLLSCASIFVLLISTLFSPNIVSASRCGERLPVTLLSLYRNSDFVYIGTFDRTEVGEVEEDDDEYTVVPIKKIFSVSTSLKGETKKMLVLEESEYRYKTKPVVEEESEAETTEPTEAEATETEQSDTEEAEEVEEPEVDAVDDTELKPGDRVLLFLNEDEDGELDLSDYEEGIKKMTPERLAAYEPRIRELNSIFSNSEPTYAQIDEWIVRCAEDPITRWEGAYELVRSFEQMDRNAERAKFAERKGQAEDGEDVDTERYDSPAPKKFDTGDENFAKELSEGQKLLLTNILLNRPRPNSDRAITNETPVMGINRGDRELIEVVKRWGDMRVATNVLEQLRYDSSDPNLNVDLMGSIASILGDGPLNELQEKYSVIQWRSAYEEVDTEDDDSAEQTAAEGTDPSGSETENVAGQKAAVKESESAEALPNAPADSETRAILKKELKKKTTYGAQREDILRTFIKRADRLIIEHDKSEKNE